MFNEHMAFVDGQASDSSVSGQFKDKDFDFVFIDACHCSACTLRDAESYFSKVKVGGYLGFHDSSPTFQGGSEQPYTPQCAEDRHIGVQKAIDVFLNKNDKFEFFLQEYHTDIYYGGVSIFKRVK